jgi:hypothetical protein
MMIGFGNILIGAFYFDFSSMVYNGVLEIPVGDLLQSMTFIEEIPLHFSS